MNRRDLIAGTVGLGVAAAPGTAASAAAKGPHARRNLATHSFHEINQYYPMRSVRTRRYSYALADLRSQLRDWRAATHDPWLPGITDPFGHAH